MDRTWMVIALAFARTCEGGEPPAPAERSSSSASSEIDAQAPASASARTLRAGGGTASASSGASAAAGAPVEAWAVVHKACPSGTFVSNGQSVVYGEPVHQYLRFHADGVAISTSVLASRIPGSPPPAFFHRDHAIPKKTPYRAEGTELRFMIGTWEYALDLKRAPFRAVSKPAAGGANDVDLFACIPAGS